jgi:hypothetical protein
MTHSRDRRNRGHGLKHGAQLRAAVEVRRDELEIALARLRNGPAQNSAAVEAIESALAGVEALLPEDLDEIPAVLSAQLAHWLEVTRYLGMLDAPTTGANP